MVPPLRVTFLGHSTVLLELGSRRILTDPILLDRRGALRRVVHSIDPNLYANVDLVLVSHLHLDHFDVDSLRLLPANVDIVVPKGAGPLLARLGFSSVHELAPGAGVRLGDLSVTATRASHGGYKPPFGPRAAAVGYLIDGPPRVYFAGDTDLFARMADLAPIDLALLPVWGWGPNLGRGHLDPRRAARTLELLRPRWAIPIHWGTLWPIGLRRVRRDRLTDPPHEFARLAGSAYPDCRVIVAAPGEVIALLPEPFIDDNASI